MKKLIFLFVLLSSVLSINAQPEFRLRKCECCDKTIDCKISGHRNDSVVMMAFINIWNDNIDKHYYQLHYSKIKGYSTDTIDVIKDVFDNIPKYVNIMNYIEYRDDISKDFKYGFINKYGWSTNSVNGIDFNITYTNTNTKTIKYIDVYCTISNPVGDICRILYNGSNMCKFTCVGPLEQFETASWNWDSAYYTTSDASKLKINKIVLTFMDNTKYTLIKEIAYSRDDRFDQYDHLIE